MPKITQEDVDKQIRGLTDLLEASEDFMIKLIPDATKRVNFRRQCLVHMFALCINTTDGFNTLVKDKNIYTAGILARSVLEQWINMQYIYLTTSYENLVRYLYDGDEIFIRNAKQLEKIYVDLNHNNEFQDLIEDVRGGIDYRVASSNSLKKYNLPIKKMPTFIERVKMIDKEKNSSEHIINYYYFYTHLSKNVHTTKDKIIEMTYADNYQEWMQATSQDSIPYETAVLINIVSINLEEVLKFVSRKHRLILT